MKKFQISKRKLLHIVQRGQTIVEMLIAIGLLAIVVPALLAGLYNANGGKPQQNQRIEAVALMKEAEEAVRSARERGWSFFAVNGTFHPAVVNNEWILQANQESINGFTRSLVISDVYRDINGVIVESGGTLDGSTKKITITVSWGSPYFSSASSAFYLTRYNYNRTYTQTTEADFTAGTKVGVIVTNTSGGEVLLGAGGLGLWCSPNLTIEAENLPKSGIANAVTAIEGKVYAGTGDNASGESFATVSISNTHPPNATIIGTFSNYKTNDVFGELNYGYIATDANPKEIVILDIANQPYSEIGYFDSPGSTDANSVFILGTTGYMTAGNVFYNFNLTSKVGSRLAIDSDGIVLAGTGTSIAVVGSYAYVSISGNSSTEMQIIDLSNPSSLSIVGQANVAGLDAQDLFVNSSSTRAYLATAASLTQRELFIIDISTKSGNRPTIGNGYDTNGMNPKGVTVVPGNRAIIVGTGGEEYQVVNISTEGSPTKCGGLEINTGVNGIASILESDGDAYSYIITGDVDSELKIIEGGPGGQYSVSGTFESNTFDASASSAFNRAKVTFNQPSQAQFKYQVAIADAVNNSCIGIPFSYVGQDKTDQTFFATSSAIPLDDDGVGFENPGQCLRYKVFLSTNDITQTPELFDITFNYSP